MADSVLGELEEWFDIEREVVGVHCSGRRARLDAVLRPKDATGWADEKPIFGVEFKLAANKPGYSYDTNDFIHWLAQAADYTHVDWRGYGRLRIFACPSPFAQLAQLLKENNSLELASLLLSRMLWQFGVGELAKMEMAGWALLAQQDQVLWSQRQGVHIGKRWSLVPKVGTR